MSEKKNLKRELVLKEREQLLKEVENIDALLEGEINPEAALDLLERWTKKFSFTESVNWLQPFIEDNLSDIQGRLNKLVRALEDEFLSSFSIDNQSEQEREKYFRQTKAHILIKMYLDSSLMLYVLGRNGAAIIELHAAVERQAIETLSQQILLPEKLDIGLRLIERSTLPDISIMLRDCGLIDGEDIKFAQKLNKLRNGLAHRNAKVISNAVYSGRKLSELAIDQVMSDVDYIPFVIGAVNFLIKITEWHDGEE